MNLLLGFKVNILLMWKENLLFGWKVPGRSIICARFGLPEEDFVFNTSVAFVKNIQMAKLGL